MGPEQLVALLSFFTVNCGRDKETDKPDVTNTASLRFTHASADVPEVDIYADDLETPLVSGVKYGDTTNYLPLAASSHVFHFRPAGGGAELPPLFSSAAIRLESSKPMSAVITGLLEENSLGATRGERARKADHEVLYRSRSAHRRRRLRSAGHTE